MSREKIAKRILGQIEAGNFEKSEKGWLSLAWRLARQDKTYKKRFKNSADKASEESSQWFREFGFRRLQDPAGNCAEANVDSLFDLGPQLEQKLSLLRLSQDQPSKLSGAPSLAGAARNLGNSFYVPLLMDTRFSWNEQVEIARLHFEIARCLDSESRLKHAVKVQSKKQYRKRIEQASGKYEKQSGSSQFRRYKTTQDKRESAAVVNSKKRLKEICNKKEYLNVALRAYSDRAVRLRKELNSEDS